MPSLTMPFDALPKIDDALRRELEAAAMEANQRYLVELIEEHSFCPFSRGGRAQGQTARFVHYVGDSDVSPLVDLMVNAASDPSLVVVQAILPMIEVSPSDWARFCHDLTALGNRKIGREVFVVAPLHPELPYKTTNAFTLIPLFRRAPDPTLQWVRLDGLDALYEGRTGDTTFVDARNIMAFMKQKHRPPLFDRIAETNLHMANRLGIDRVEQSLAELSRTARRRYTNIFLGGGGGPQASERGGCPCGGDSDPAPAPGIDPVLAERHERVWALIALRELKQREPCHVRVEDIDLVVVRVGKAVHVLYGRCPHRLALLSDAIMEHDRLVCRHHGWDFSLETGASESVPGESVHRFAAWIESGRVWINASELAQWRSDNAQAFELGELIP